MKICMIMLAPEFGGGERLYVDLTAALVRRGHDVLAIFRAGSEAGRRLEPLDNLQRASIRGLGTWDPLAPRKIRRLVQAHGSEIIQTVLGRATHFAGPAARQLKIPLLAHTHDFVHLKYFRHADVLVPSTTAQCDYLEDEGFPAARIRLIRLFSALEPVAEVRCNERVTSIAAGGKFAHMKGFDLLLRAFGRLADDNVRLYLAGEGTERRRLESLAASLDLGERVRFVGWQDDIRGFLLQSDLFVLPSRHESFGIVLLEAMACGVPIVATRCHGPLEVLDDDSAWLCEADSEDALCAAMTAAIGDPEGRRRRARSAWTRFRERYAIDRVLPEYEELYDEARRSSAEGAG